MMMNMGLNGGRSMVGGFRRTFANEGLMAMAKQTISRGVISLHSQWAGQALHSHYFGQGGRTRFGRRGRTKG